MSGFDVFADCARHGHAFITVTKEPGVEECVTCGTRVVDGKTEGPK